MCSELPSNINKMVNIKLVNTIIAVGLWMFKFKTIKSIDVNRMNITIKGIKNGY